MKIFKLSILSPILIIFLGAPGFALTWWMYLMIAVLGLVFLGKKALDLDVILIGTLPIWALTMEFFISTEKMETLIILSFWLTQISAYLVVKAIALDADKKYWSYFLTILLIVILGFLTMDACGYDPNKVFPSYKDAKGAQEVAENFTSYGQSALQRLRGFYGESSILSAALVFIATLTAVATHLAPVRKIGSIWRAISYGFVGITIMAFLFVLSKSGFAVLLGGAVLALIAANLRSSALARIKILSALVAVAVLAVVALAFAPASLKEYFNNESENISDALDNRKVGPLNGSASRIDHWMMTFDCLARYPLGSGLAGVKETYDNPRWFDVNAEMKKRVPNGIYGLMNQAADIGVETGLYGLIILIVLIKYNLRGNNIMGLRALMLGELVVFAFTVESFPYLALIPLTGAVLGRDQKETRQMTRRKNAPRLLKHNSLQD